MIKKYFYNDAFYKKIIKKKKDVRVLKEYQKILKYRKMINLFIKIILKNLVMQFSKLKNLLMMIIF